jgi:hypothetical protein
MNSRHLGVPIFVFTELSTGGSRCINGLHVQTFVPNPFGDGTLLTFVNGDSVTLMDTFEAIVDTFMSDRQDG